MSTKSNEAISFRLPATDKILLTATAQSHALSISSYLKKVVDEYGPLKRDSQHLKATEKELKAVQKLFAATESKLAFYENSKFDDHFQVLRGHEVGGRVISTKEDLFKVMTDHFEYVNEDGRIELMDNPVSVKKQPFISSVLAILILVLAGIIGWLLLKKKTNLEISPA